MRIIFIIKYIPMLTRHSKKSFDDRRIGTSSSYFLWSIFNLATANSIVLSTAESTLNVSSHTHHERVYSTNIIRKLCPYINIQQQRVNIFPFFFFGPTCDGWMDALFFLQKVWMLSARIYLYLILYVLYLTHFKSANSNRTYRNL